MLIIILMLLMVDGNDDKTMNYKTGSITYGLKNEYVLS